MKAPKRSVLVFIHGFNNRFEDAVYRFAQIVHDFDAPTSCRCCSPGPRAAASSPMAMTARAPTIRATRWRLCCRTSRAIPSVGEVSILAHSMGNWVTLEALRQMAIRNGRHPAEDRATSCSPRRMSMSTCSAPRSRDIGRASAAASRCSSRRTIGRWRFRAASGAARRAARRDRPGRRALPDRALQADSITVIDLTKLQLRRQPQPRQVRRKPGGGAADRHAAGRRASRSPIHASVSASA